MNRRNTLSLLASAVLACTGAMALPAAAQNKAMAQMAGYTGADRAQKILDGAKKEGSLDIYTSAQSDDMGAVVKAFEAKYGIKVTMWRSSSEKVLQRSISALRKPRSKLAL